GRDAVAAPASGDGERAAHERTVQAAGEAEPQHRAEEARGHGLPPRCEGPRNRASRSELSQPTDTRSPTLKFPRSRTTGALTVTGMCLSSIGPTLISPSGRATSAPGASTLTRNVAGSSFLLMRWRSNGS